MMGLYSHWEITFKYPDGSDIDQIMDRVNDFINTPFTVEGISANFRCSYSKPNTEALTEWETTSFSAQAYAEHDLEVLSAAFPDLVFHCHASIDNDDPDFYINAKAGELEWNFGDIVYPGFKKIIYDEEDMRQFPYTVEEMRIAISDMQKLTDVVRGRMPEGKRPSTEVALWALTEVLRNYYGEEIE